MTPQELIADQKAGRRAAWFWGSFVVGFLGLQVIIGIVAFFLATGDPSVAVVPNYYQKALDFDKQQAIELASSKLSWDAKVEISEIKTVEGYRDVDVRLLDRDGQPVKNLDGNLKLYHHARAADVQAVELEAVGDGNYRGRAKMPREGLWQIEMIFENANAGETFVLDETYNVGSTETQLDGSHS
jgi:nitrogen fixation protein FixH